jgi:hypothetical protein
MGAVSRLENGWASRHWGFDSLSFRHFTEAWPSWKGGALLARRRQAAARRFESCCLRRLCDVVQIGRTTGCYPVDAGSSPAVAASPPRSSSRSRTPVSQTGDAGSNPARGTLLSDASGNAARLSPGRGGFDSRRERSRRRSVDEHRAPTAAHGGSTPPGEPASQG